MFISGGVSMSRVSIHCLVNQLRRQSCNDCLLDEVGKHVDTGLRIISCRRSDSARRVRAEVVMAMDRVTVAADRTAVCAELPKASVANDLPMPEQ